MHTSHHMLRLDISIQSRPFSYMGLRTICSNDNFSMNIKGFSHGFASDSECSIFFSFKAFCLGLDSDFCPFSCSNGRHVLIKYLTLKHISCIRQIDLVFTKPNICSIRSNESYTADFISDPMRIHFKVQFFKNLF